VVLLLLAWLTNPLKNSMIWR